MVVSKYITELFSIPSPSSVEFEDGAVSVAKAEKN